MKRILIALILAATAFSFNIRIANAGGGGAPLYQHPYDLFIALERTPTDNYVMTVKSNKLTIPDAFVSDWDYAVENGFFHLLINDIDLNAEFTPGSTTVNGAQYTSLEAVRTISKETVSPTTTVELRYGSNSIGKVTMCEGIRGDQWEAYHTGEIIDFECSDELIDQVNNGSYGDTGQAEKAFDGALKIAGATTVKNIVFLSACIPGVEYGKSENFFNIYYKNPSQGHSNYKKLSNDCSDEDIGDCSYDEDGDGKDDYGIWISDDRCTDDDPNLIVWTKIPTVRSDTKIKLEYHEETYEATYASQKSTQLCGNSYSTVFDVCNPFVNIEKVYSSGSTIVIETNYKFSLQATKIKVYEEQGDSDVRIEGAYSGIVDIHCAEDDYDEDSCGMKLRTSIPVDRLTGNYNYYLKYSRAKTDAFNICSRLKANPDVAESDIPEVCNSADPSDDDNSNDPEDTETINEDNNSNDDNSNDNSNVTDDDDDDDLDNTFESLGFPMFTNGGGNSPFSTSSDDDDDDDSDNSTSRSTNSANADEEAGCSLNPHAAPTAAGEMLLLALIAMGPMVLSRVRRKK